jgi:hypothetical protein
MNILAICYNLQTLCKLSTNHVVLAVPVPLATAGLSLVEVYPVHFHCSSSHDFVQFLLQRSAGGAHPKSIHKTALKNELFFII